MLNQTAIEGLKDNTDLRDLAGDYTELRKESNVEMSGPCPRCGGDDRFHVKADWFFCRQCNAEGGDVIDFLQWVGAAHTFTDAVEMLDGYIENPKPTRKARPVQRQQPITWNAAGRQILNLANMQEMLFADDNPGADYLRGRSLHPSTWVGYGLGYTQDAVKRGDAIAIPWYTAGALTAIRYRLIEPIGKQKIISEPGSQFGGKMYGGQIRIQPGPERMLIVCEGEINAMSIYQATIGGTVDVLSVGSESAKISDAMVNAAQRYSHVIAWFDRSEVSNKMALRLGGWAVTSPDGRDANDLLQVMKLTKFIDALVAKVQA